MQHYQYTQYTHHMILLHPQRVNRLSLLDLDMTDSYRCSSHFLNMPCSFLCTILAEIHSLVCVRIST